MSDLVSLVVTVRPADALRLPAHTGRAIYAQLLRWLGDIEPALASQWHDVDGPKPYTCSSLVGGKRVSKGQREYVPETEYWFRLTALDASIAAVLLKLQAAPPAQVEIDGAALPVTGMTTDAAQHPWAGMTTYHELAAPYLLASEPPPRAIRISFETPTAFRQAGMHLPVPLPELVFGGLADRWNAFSPNAISPHLREYCQSGVAMSHYDLRTGSIPGGDGRSEIGAMGSARYVHTRHDRYWMSMVTLLAGYAFYSGVGRLTTIGMGQARRV